MRRLGVTRTAEELAGLNQRATERGWTLVPLPLIETRAIDFEWPPPLALKAGDWLVFTSARGVRFFFTELAKRNIELTEGLRFAVVGERTKAALGEFGLTANFLPEGSGGEELFRELIAKFVSPADRVFSVVYISAERPRFDPANLFMRTVVRYQRIPVYRTIDRETPESLVEDFTKEDKILYTSPLAARSYAQRFGAPVAQPLAIGETTAREISDLGWTVAEVLPEPNIEAALSLVET